MEARVGTLAVGAQFDTLLTGRRGVVRARGEFGVIVGYADRQPAQSWEIHPDVRVRVVEVTH